MTNAATTQKALLAAALTVKVVAQAQRVRGLSRAEAVALVATHTGATVETVEAQLELGAQVVAVGAELLAQAN